jgi:hypothetical protein
MIRAFPLLALGLGLAVASGTILAMRGGPDAVAGVQEPASRSALPVQQGNDSGAGISTCANDGEARRCRSSGNAASG